MVYRIREKVKAKKLINEKIQYRPEKRFCTLDSADFYLPKQELVLIFFNSGCEHCQYEMKDVREKINLFKGRPIVFLSSENISVISSASRNFKLDSLPNVTFAKINPDDVFDAFGSVSIPHIFIYDQPGKLIKEFKGETKVEAIANSLP
jgi:thioredoxin-related protein